MQSNEKVFIKNAVLNGVRFLNEEEVNYVFVHKSLTNATVCVTKNKNNYFLTFYFRKFNGNALVTNFKLFDFVFSDLEEWLVINNISCEIFLYPNELDSLSFPILFDAIIYTCKKLEVFDFSGQIQKTGLNRNIVNRTIFITLNHGTVKEKLLFFNDKEEVTIINKGTQLERESCDAILLVYEKDQKYNFHIIKRNSLTYKQLQICMKIIKTH